MPKIRMKIFSKIFIHTERYDFSKKIEKFRKEMCFDFFASKLKRKSVKP
jgi:hypothetical protein